MNLPGISYIIIDVISSSGGKEHKSLLLVGLHEHLIDTQPYPSPYKGAIYEILESITLNKGDNSKEETWINEKQQKMPAVYMGGPRWG